MEYLNNNQLAIKRKTIPICLIQNSDDNKM